jgi:hypothetical protein
MNQSFLFFIALIGLGFISEGFCQTAPFSTSNIKKIEKDQCQIVVLIGSPIIMPWCGSPCEKMYGRLPGVKCPQ